MTMDSQPPNYDHYLRPQPTPESEKKSSEFELAKAILPDFEGKRFSTGQKWSEGKPKFSYFSYGVWKELLKVPYYGELKYERDNWQLVDNPQEAYTEAAIRHLLQGLDEDIDEESGLMHVAQAACNSLFLVWFALKRGVVSSMKRPPSKEAAIAASRDQA